VSVLVAMVLFAGVVLYSLFGGADFGAGFWDLTAGGAAAGRRARALIDRSVGPVWEANHVWLIFCLVVLWTAFPAAFAAITTTLYVPLAFAVLGIVLRGSGFAFRKAVVTTPARRAAGVVFASSSVLTPFFLGTVAGGIASGRVPAVGDGGASPASSWLNPTSVLGGALAVVTCAYLAGVFLAAEARLRGAPDLERTFRLRALAAAVVAGALSLGGILVLREDAGRLFHRLLGPGLPLVAVSVVTGLGSLVLLRRGPGLMARALAVTAVASIVLGWGIAQYPYLLGTRLPVHDAAAPDATLWSVVVVAGAAVVLCFPSLAFLYTLQQRGRLEEP